jgi:hypothetical protein
LRLKYRPHIFLKSEEWRGYQVSKKHKAYAYICALRIFHILFKKRYDVDSEGFPVCANLLNDLETPGRSMSIAVNRA